MAEELDKLKLGSEAPVSAVHAVRLGLRGGVRLVQRKRTRQKRGAQSVGDDETVKSS